MKQLQFSLLFIIVTLSVSTVKAQKWYEMTLESKIKIEEVKEEAERYFEIMGTGPHTGYKGYRRWLYTASLNMDENGYVYTVENLLREKKEFNKNANQKTSKIANETWSPVGPYSVTRGNSRTKGMGRVVSIAVEPVNQQLIFVGSPGGGIWRSTDGGASWEPKGDYLDVMSIWAIAIDPNDSNHILHLNYGSRLLESFDLGDTWTHVATLGNFLNRATMIKFHPTNSNIYFVAEGGALFKTENSGTTFTSVISEKVEDVFFKPGDINTMYACGDDFFKSTDLGATWTKITSGITHSERMKMAVTTADPDRVYIVQKSGSGFGRTYESKDSGTSFVIKADIDDGATNYLGSQASRDMAIMCSNTDADEVYLGALDSYRSVNGAESFETLAYWNSYSSTAFIHADVEVMINVEGTLYAGTDGGIYRSTDRGENYTSLAMNGIAVTQFYRLGGTSPYPETGAGLDPHMVVSGSQDNGTMITKTVDHDWTGWLGGDGMECFIDYTNDEIVYGESQTGSLYTSIDGGTNFLRLNRPETNGAWVTPFEMDPIIPTTLYVGYKEVYKSINSGVDWEPITSGESEGAKYDLIKIAHSDNNYIYLAEDDRLWISTNGQEDDVIWTELETNGNLNYISIDPNDEKHVVTTNTGGKVYETVDAGLTWDNITGNLPNMTAFCASIDSSADNRIYIGMSQGVYYKDDNMTDWELFGSGLPNCAVRELEINYHANLLRVATYGRGIWEIPVSNLDVLSVSSEDIDNKKYSDIIYPNPIDNYLNFSLDYSEGSSITIVNVNGQIVRQQVLSNNRMDVRELTSGVYYLKINDGGMEKTYKFIKR
ncbi:MAG: T9SS type A sorting domain-containing protein [Algibacter sp.]